MLTGRYRNRETAPEEAKAPEAVKWLQKAFALAEHLDDTVTAGSAQLKVSKQGYHLCDMFSTDADPHQEVHSEELGQVSHVS